MKQITYSFENWGFKLAKKNNIIRIICNTGKDVVDRYYKFKGKIQMVDLAGEYIQIFVKSKKTGDRMYQIKFEGKHGLVGDIYEYDGGDFIDTFAYYDFVDDEPILDCEEID